MKHTHRLFALLFVCSCLTTLQAAPPNLTSLFPAGGKIGETVEIKANGTFANWPCQAWCNHPGIKISAAKEKGKFTAAIDKQVPPGAYLVRFYDKEGASVLKPFIVDTANEVLEKEPNEKLEDLKPLANPVVVNGALSKSADVDCFLIEATKGQTLVASVTANRRLGSPMDAILQICDERGFVLAQNDDSRGIDPLVTLPIAQDGKYQVRLFAFPETPNSSIGFSGQASYIYRLTITTGAFLDFSLPLAHSNVQAATGHGWNLATAKLDVPTPQPQYGAFASLGGATGWVQLAPSAKSNVVAAADTGPKKPQRISLPATISGIVEKPADVDTFMFTAKKGTKYRIQTFGRSLGFPIDPLVQVRDLKRVVLSENDDMGRSVRDPSFVFTPKNDGDHLVEIRDLHRHGGPRFAYRIELSPVSPQAKLTTTADHFTLKAGANLAIDVNVARLDGFTEELTIAPRSLPKGVTAAAVKSEAKGKTAKAVKLNLKAAKDAAPAQFELVLVAKSKSGERTVDFAVPKSDLVTHRLWLTVTK